MPDTLPSELALGPAAITELLKPARLELFEALQLAGEATMAELAARLGRPADALYYHMKKLVELGVVVVREDPAAGSRGRGRHASVYGLAARQVRLKLEPSSKRSREAWAGGAAAVLRQTERDVRAAVQAGDVRTEGARRNLSLARIKVRLKPRQLQELNRHLDEITRIVRGNENTQGAWFSVTLALAPLAERQRT